MRVERPEGVVEGGTSIHISGGACGISRVFGIYTLFTSQCQNRFYLGA